MAIATAGIIDQEWADLLKSWIAGDRYVDYYIETGNHGINLPVDSDDSAKIRSEYSYIDSITGLRFRETSDEAAADIYSAQVDRSFFASNAESRTLGETSIESNGAREYFMVLYVDQAHDNAVIRHEIGHTLGLEPVLVEWRLSEGLASSGHVLAVAAAEAFAGNAVFVPVQLGVAGLHRGDSLSASLERRTVLSPSRTRTEDQGC